MVNTKFKDTQIIDLFKLHDDMEDKGAYSWIVADGSEIVVNFKFLINKITEKLNCSVKSLSRKVSKRIGCSTSMLYDVLNGRTKWIPLFLIDDLLDILKESNRAEEVTELESKFLESIEFLKSTPRSAVKIKVAKKLSPELAEFCGIHTADGSLNLGIDLESKNKKSLGKIKNKLRLIFPELKISKIRKRENKYRISFNLTSTTRKRILKYLDMHKINFSVHYLIEFMDSEKGSMEYLKKLICELFGYTLKIKPRKEGRGYYAIFSNKILGRYLKNIFNFPIGKKSDIVEAPELVKKSSFCIQKAFTRGLIQFDGSVKMNGRVAFSTNSEKLFSFFLVVIGKDKLSGTIWRRKNRDKELGFESPPLKKWLGYFIPNTSKHQRLYEHIYGFKGGANLMSKTGEIFDKAFARNNNLTLTFSKLIKTIPKIKVFTKYQILDKLDVSYYTLSSMLRILEKAKAIKVNRVEMLERLDGKSDGITFNPNVREWKVPIVMT